MKNILKVVLACMLACSTLVLAQQSAEELARAYIDARNAYDIETTKTLLTEDAKIIELGDEYSIKALAAFLAYAKAQDFRWEVDSCTAEDIGIYDVACSYVVANSISDALEVDPIPGGTVSFTIEDEKIALASLVYPIDEWSPNVFSMMIAFIRANHYEDFRTLLPDGFPTTVSEEGLVMWRNYTDEFVEVVGAAKANPTITTSEQIGFDFLEARGSRGAEAMGALMADEVESFDVGRASDAENYADIFGWYESLNWNWTGKTCDDIGESDGVTKILCVAELENDVSRGLGNGSYNMGWGLEIKDEKIIGIYPEWNRAFINDNLTPLKQYILKNHNADYAKMYTTGGNLVRGAENQELLKTYVADFLTSMQDQTATTYTVSEQIGFNFFKAMDTWDAEAIANLLADEVESFDVLGANNLEDYTEVFAWYESLNWNWIAKSCDERDSSNGVSKILCVVEASNDISRGLGNKVYDMDWRLSIKDDKIIFISPSWSSAFAQDNLVPFKYYILETNREDFDKMYTSQGFNFVRGEENLELLKTYVPKFIASQE